MGEWIPIVVPIKSPVTVSLIPYLEPDSIYHIQVGYRMLITMKAWGVKWVSRVLCRSVVEDCLGLCRPLYS